VKQTYVFDFYNLYIPRGKQYKNDGLGIRIAPLKFAEEFEKHRRSFSKLYHSGGWKTAKCFIKAENEEDAKRLASWIEFLYSFAQSRSVFFLGWYKYKKGKKYSSFQAKFVIPRENRFSELVSGVSTRGAFFTRDIAIFIDASLKTLSESKEGKLKNILTAIHSYELSRSETVWELRFLICWIVLEKLANIHYDKLKSKSQLFSKIEKRAIKNSLAKTLDENLEHDRRLPFLKRSLTRNFLYEHDTFEKVRVYLESLNLGFENKKLNALLKNLVKIRVGLVHRLDSALLEREPQLLFDLQKIMENVIFRLLGVSKQMQSKLLLHQYNRGNKL